MCGVFSLLVAGQFSLRERESEERFIKIVLRENCSEESG